MSDSGDDGARAVATASVDRKSCSRRHLRAQLRLYASVTRHADNGRAYRSAVVWALTMFLHALQDCTTSEALRQRALQTTWWNALVRSELGCTSLLELRVSGVPLSGHSLAEAALAPRHVEIAQYLMVDPTMVLDAAPSDVLTWLREP